jgi:hypothetical protein
MIIRLGWWRLWHTCVWCGELIRRGMRRIEYRDGVAHIDCARQMERAR